METKPAALTILCLVAATAAYDYLLNPHLPAIIPSHWNIAGSPDAFSPKMAVYVMLLAPMLLMLALPFVLSRLPGAQPSRTVGNYMVVAGAALLAYVNGVILQFVLHPGLDFSKVYLTGLLLFFLLLGNVLGKTRRNANVGIRLPWTLNSDANWLATHRLAGRLWVGVSLAGIVLLWLGLPLAVLLPTVFLPLVVVPILYSYLLFRRTQTP